MIHRLYNQRTSTDITAIKSFVYTEESNVTDNIRFGACTAATIEVVIFKTNNTFPDYYENPVQTGDVIEYYQIDNNNVQTKIGVFTAKVDAPERKTISFVGYDNIWKLEIDYSNRLKALNTLGRFPMTSSALVQDAASIAGVTERVTNTSYHPSGITNTGFMSISLKAFYADTITVRQVFSQYAELAGCYIRCDPDGNIILDSYNFDYVNGNSTKYLVCPTDQVMAYVAARYTPIYYKENGLVQANYQADMPSEVSIFDSNGTLVYWRDTSSHYWDDGKVYIVSANMFIDNATNTVANPAINIMDRLEMFKYMDSYTEYTNPHPADPDDPSQGTMYDETVYTVYRTYKPTTIQLFPFNNPFRVGDVYYYTTMPDDLPFNDNLLFRGVITKLEITDEAATMTGTGTQVYQSTKDFFEPENQRIVSIESRLNDIDSTGVTSKVSKSGDTMTGDLVMSNGTRCFSKNPYIDISATSQAANRDQIFAMVNDKNSNMSNVLYARQETDGKLSTRLATLRKDGNGNTIWNTIYLNVAADGTRSVEFTDPAIWRAAIFADTGWQTFPLSSNFEAFTSSYTPKYRVINGVCYLSGIIKPKTTLTYSGGPYTIGTLPTGARPTLTEMYFFGQGGGMRRFDVQVGSSGAVKIDRYGISSGEDYATGAMLAFTVQFPVG